MSKSDDNEANFIGLLEDPKQIVKKIKRAMTDSDEPSRGALLILRTSRGLQPAGPWMSGVTGRSIPELEQHFEGKMYGHLKSETADAVVALLEPIQARFRELRQDETHLRAILAAGAQKARKGLKTLTSVYDVVGFVPRA